MYQIHILLLSEPYPAKANCTELSRTAIHTKGSILISSYRFFRQHLLDGGGRQQSEVAPALDYNGADVGCKRLVADFFARISTGFLYMPFDFRVEQCHVHHDDILCGFDTVACERPRNRIGLKFKLIAGAARCPTCGSSHSVERRHVRPFYLSIRRGRSQAACLCFNALGQLSSSQISSKIASSWPM